MAYNSRRGSCESIGEKGFFSDRCELNRQIKADNALLRELKAQMKKMAQAVKTVCLLLRKLWKHCVPIFIRRIYP